MPQDTRLDWQRKNLDRFVRALVPEIRLQMELRGPQNFHEAAMFAEHVQIP